MASSNAVKYPIGTKLSKDEGGTKVDATLFKHVVGSLMYLTATRPDLMYYREEGNAKLVAFTDNGYAGDIDDRQSTSGYVFKIGNGVVSWSSKKTCDGSINN
ncbi:secreted RxLR effector protein 161-like [Apium graveolens]|uniref:secreted RxLR effector protein 161-like n=1 Tax=Apium graveolens TaxID=4045 RepID=UPI003D7B7E12